MLYHVPSANFIQKTLGAELLSGVTAAATLNNVTSIQNKLGVMIIDRLDTNGGETPNKVEVISFAGTSGSTVTTLVRGLAGTTEQDHAVGAIVEFGPDIIWAQGLITSFEAEHNQDGTHGAITATSVTVGGVAVPTVSSTSTLTNKAITQRVVTTTDDATAVIDVTVTDDYELSAIANATTFSTTGTPTNGQKFVLRFKDAGVAKDLTWDPIFVAIGCTLPTTTVAGKWHYVGGKYNTAASKIHILAVAQES